MLAIIDNYDSFTWNLVQILGNLGARPVVFRNDETTPLELSARGIRALIVSPGPCTPKKAGISVDAIRELSKRTPTLGVCLGCQALGEAFGAATVRAARVVHGKVSAIAHAGDDLFQGVPSPFGAARYHSLVTDGATLPEELRPIAWSADAQDKGEVQAMRHRARPAWGVQFHPESWFTEHGRRILSNFLSLSGA